jgi:hypothetical protein
MSTKYLKLSFKNAKFFPKNNKTKDIVANISLDKKNKLIFTHNKRVESENSSFKEPITVHQIANVLLTLIGERPVPSFRDTFYSKDKNIVEMANNSYLNIKSPKTIKKIKDETYEVFIEEMVKLDKAVWNSWSKPNVIHWFKIKKLLADNFDEFIGLINEALGYDVLSKPFEDLVNAYSVYGSKLDRTIEFLTKIKRTPVINFLTKAEPDRSEITKNGLLGETVNSGIDYASFLDGEILVPYNETYVNAIVKNTTNILDGGYVKIEGIFYDDELGDTSDFRLVSDISDEKY